MANSDRGILKTIERSVYLTQVCDRKMHFIGRDGRAGAFTIDPTEYQFKLALELKQHDKVFHLIRTSNLVGMSIISFLRSKGYPEVAIVSIRSHWIFCILLGCVELCA